MPPLAVAVQEYPTKAPPAPAAITVSAPELVQKLSSDYLSVNTSENTIPRFTVFHHDRHHSLKFRHRHQ